METKDLVYKDIEPGVINNAMIFKAVDEQFPPGEAGRLARIDGIELEDVTALRLEFLNILRMDHLWMMTSLSKLSLSNNMLEKIENISALVNLKELDLSFNNIRVIENLDELILLEVLTLYSNRISMIENMGKLRKLHVFSIGNNLIEDKECIFNLRRIKTLRSINMAGNPCTDDKYFRPYVATFLPQLSYYEYKLITVKEREKGLELYSARLKEVQEGEIQEVMQEEREEAEREEAELHAESFIEFLGGRQLFDSLFEKDVDGHVLLMIDDVQEYYNDYEENFIATTRRLFEMGQEKYRIRKHEVTQFFDCVETAKLENQQKSQGVMENFVEKQNVILREAKSLQEIANEQEMDFMDYNEQMQILAEEFNALIHVTWKQLMGLEIGLFDQLEEINLTFERALTELVQSFIEESQGLFTLARSLEQNYMELVSEAANRLMAMHNIQEDPYLADELKPLMEDKEVLNNAVASSHDMHMQLIDGREDRLVSKAKAWLDNLVTNLRQNEIIRNRDKVLEINHFLDIQKENFEDIQDKPIFDADVSAALEN